MQAWLNLPELPKEIRHYTPVDVYMPETLYDHWSWSMTNIWDWCDKNCKGKFDSRVQTSHTGHKTWLFELPEDASFFSLKWLS